MSYRVLSGAFADLRSSVGATDADSSFDEPLAQRLAQKREPAGGSSLRMQEQKHTGKRAHELEQVVGKDAIAGAEGRGKLVRRGLLDAQRKDTPSSNLRKDVRDVDARE